MTNNNITVAHFVLKTPVYSHTNNFSQKILLLRLLDKHLEIDIYKHHLDKHLLRKLESHQRQLI